MIDIGSKYFHLHQNHIFLKLGFVPSEVPFNIGKRPSTKGNQHTACGTLTLFPSFLILIPFLFFFSCQGCQKDKLIRPLLNPPSLSIFQWGLPANQALETLQKEGWQIESKDSNQIILYIPISVKDKELANIVAIANHKIPNLSEITFHIQKDKLMLLQLHRYDTKEWITKYTNNLMRDYGLEQPIWSKQRMNSQDSLKNVFTQRISLYDKKDFFAALYQYSVIPKEKSLGKGLNHHMELLLYGKHNEGLTREVLLQQLKNEAESPF